MGTQADSECAAAFAQRVAALLRSSGVAVYLVGEPRPEPDGPGFRTQLVVTSCVRAPTAPGTGDRFEVRVTARALHERDVNTLLRPGGVLHRLLGTAPVPVAMGQNRTWGAPAPRAGAPGDYPRAVKSGCVWRTASFEIAPRPAAVPN